MGLQGGLNALVQMSGSISETGGGGGGSEVEYTQIQQTGTKIGILTIDGINYDIYAPTGGGGGSEVEYTQIQQTGTKIGTITIDNTPIDIYSPDPTVISYNDLIVDVATNTIGKLTINSIENPVTIPNTNYSVNTTNPIYDTLSLSYGDNTTNVTIPTTILGMKDTSFNNLQNGQILAFNGNTSKWENRNPSGASWIDITGTLTAGNTSITLSNAAITSTSTIDVYTDTFGVNPTNVVVSTGSVTLTFAAQANNLGVKVRVS